MQYCHTQKGWWHYGLYATVAATLYLAWVIRQQPVGMWVTLGVAVLLFLLTQGFHHMTVRDEGEWLAIRFGPLPLLGKRIPYAQITSAEPDRTVFLEGWGIHWTPGRGWTYNIWGYDCVKLSLDRSTIRVGSDDVENLVRFVRERIGQPGD
jgi:hypothetical protein